MKCRTRPAFYSDIEREQLWLLEHAGAEIAERWHEALWETIAFLARHPEIGWRRGDLKQKGIRSWRVKKFERWLIFYALEGETLVLYRVVSGTMNLLKLRLG